MSTTKIETHCPHCGRRNELHGHLTSEKPPADGDVGICFGCHRVAMYVAGPLGLTTRVPTDTELAELEGDPRVAAAIEEITRIKARSN